MDNFLKPDLGTMNMPNPDLQSWDDKYSKLTIETVRELRNTLCSAQLPKTSFQRTIHIVFDAQEQNESMFYLRPEGNFEIHMKDPHSDAAIPGEGNIEAAYVLAHELGHIIGHVCKLPGQMSDPRGRGFRAQDLIYRAEEEAWDVAWEVMKSTFQQARQAALNSYRRNFDPSDPRYLPPVPEAKP